MQLSLKKPTQRLLLAAAALSLFCAASLPTAQAQTTATGQLTVSATVASSIEVQFQTAGSGVTLTSVNNTPTPGAASTATLNFGAAVSEYGTPPSNVTVTPSAPGWCGSCAWSMSTPVNVTVIAANSGSSNFSLGAYVSGTVTGTLAIAGTALTSTPVDNNLTATGTWGSYAPYTVDLGVPTAATNSEALGGTIVFSALAN